MRNLGRSRRVALAVGMALAAAGCSSGSSNKPTTTSSLPPLPPLVYAYVTMVGAGNNIGIGHTVRPVDVSPGGAGAQPAISVGTYPDAIAIAPHGKTAYVTNYTSNSVSVIDLASGKTTIQIPLGSSAGPAGIAITPDGTTAYVTDAGAPGTLGSTITPISLAKNKVLPPITVGSGPQGIAITPNGARAYVADAGSIVAGQTGSVGNTVTPVDLATGKSLGPIVVGNAPTGVAITPDGSTAIVTNLNSGSVSPINIASNKARAPISVQGGPIAVAVSPADPAIAWVADTSSNTSTGANVTPVDLSAGVAGTPIPIGKGPQGIAITPDGTTAWIVCYNASSLESIDLRTKRPGPAVRVAGGPSAIALTTHPRAGTAATGGAGSTSKATTTTKG